MLNAELIRVGLARISTLKLAIRTITPAATYTVGAPAAAQVEIVDGG